MGAISVECQARMQDNSVYRSLQVVAEVAQQVASGARKTAIVCGPTGVGKNYLFEKEFAIYGRPWRPERPVSEPALIEHIAENNRKSATLVYDEGDHIMRNQRMLNVLKIATDTKATARTLSYRVRNKKLCIDPFDVECGFVFLMNTNLHDSALLEDRRIGESIKALNSRCCPYVMPFSHEMIYEYTIYLVIYERMLMKEGYCREICEMALAYFCQTMNRVRDVSPRRVSMIAAEILRNPTNWQKYLEPTLQKPWRAPAEWQPQLEPRRSVVMANAEVVSEQLQQHVK